MPADITPTTPAAPAAPAAPASPDEPKMVKVKVLTDRPVDGHLKDEELMLEEHAANVFKEAKLVEIIK